MDGPRPEQICVLFRWFKEGPPGAIPVEVSGSPRGILRAVTWEDAGDRRALERLAAWHSAAHIPLMRGPRAWLVEALEGRGRVLFWVQDPQGESVGLIGLDNLDPTRGTIAIADVLGDELSQQALLDHAIETLTGWVRQSLKLTIQHDARAAA